MRTLLAAVVFIASSAVSAHHGFGDYDPSKIVTLTGRVVRFAHENPHSSIVIQVDTDQWLCLLPSADGLARRGIPAATFAPGATVTVKGYRHKTDRLHMRPEWLVQDGVERSLRDARGPLPGETDEDWVTLGTKLHGGFGSYVALGVYIGLDARELLGAKPRELAVSFANGRKAPCPCLADGLQLATGATPGRGSLTVASEPAPAGAFGVVTITNRGSGRTLRYTIPDDVRGLLDAWNELPPGERLPALRTVPADELFQRAEIKP